jgi:hypothetical protein
MGVIFNPFNGGLIPTGPASEGGGGVSSINALGEPALTGAVEIEPGSNVSLSQVGQSIIISATGSGVPADPLYENDLLLWLDPSDLTTITESSLVISQVEDKSANGYIFTPFSTGPTLASNYFGYGRHGITFDGVVNNLKSSVELPTYITVFMVIQSPGGTAYLMNHNNDTTYISTSNPGFQIFADDAQWGVTRTGEIQLQNGGLQLVNQKRIVQFIYGSTEQGIYFGDTLYAYSPSGTLVSNSNLTADLTLMSSSYETLYLSGTLGEVRIYNRQLTRDEHSAVRRQLSTKWGISL